MSFIFLIIGLIMLVVGAETIIRGSVSLAKQLKLSLFAVGVVVVSFGTSLPEFAGCVRAVISSYPDIAVGAIVGSNIANIALIMGTTAVLCPVLSITQNQINQSVINIIIAVGLILFSWLSLSFNFITGIVSLVLLSLIMIRQINIGSLNYDDVQDQKKYSTFVASFLIICGIVLLIFGSRFFISSAVNIAEKFSIPQSIIGASIVAFGTSLPELVVGIISAFRKKVDFALGNILGSNIYNVLGILGLSSFFGSFNIPSLIANFDLYIMTGIILFITLFMIIFKKLTRLFGIISLTTYIIYITFLYS